MRMTQIRRCSTSDGCRDEIFDTYRLSCARPLGRTDEWEFHVIESTQGMTLDTTTQGNSELFFRSGSSLIGNV